MIKCYSSPRKLRHKLCTKLKCYVWKKDGLHKNNTVQLDSIYESECMTTTAQSFIGYKKKVLLHGSCMGFDSVPQNFMSFLEPQNMTLFGNKSVMD